jgi:CheY-like chemotaxis protein
MTTRKRKPLILIVDDVPEYRERILPALARILGCRSCTAGNVQEALRLASEHSPDSGDPVALVILDMHLLIDPDHINVVDDGGLRFLHRYKFTECPIVVFTAYPTFFNCVAAIQAGATAYIPKVKRDNEGGPDALRETCEKLLRGADQAVEAPPTRDWIGRNHVQLTSKFNGKWVAFIPKEVVKSADVPQQLTELDGLLLLAGDSYEGVRAKIIELPSVLKAQPIILRVRGKGAPSLEEEE